VGTIRVTGMVGSVGVTWLMRSIGMVRTIRMVRTVGVTWLMRSIRMVWSIRMVGTVGLVRMAGMSGNQTGSALGQDASREQGREDSADDGLAVCFSDCDLCYLLCLVGLCVIGAEEVWHLNLAVVVKTAAVKELAAGGEPGWELN
jgi:hypothetical protein